MSNNAPQDEAKIVAGRRAIDTYLENGMSIGLGSGTTSYAFVRALGEKVRDGLEVQGVTTSTITRDIAREVGVPLMDINEVTQLDLTVDGADEIDRAGRMIKGGGACLLWEKIVAYTSRRMVAIVDETKLVDPIGAFPLPIEVIPYGWRNTMHQLAALLTPFGYDKPRLELRGGSSDPVVTDSGHYIIDCHLEKIMDADGMAPLFNQIPGVVENGLFVGICDEIVIGRFDGSSEIIKVRG
ncbi:ribose-5-phosphate isomerase RpiA [Salinisphaera sp.]|uniref:ribose-5-phosphate isomerase RpiA n=1 Tax=Salinisphaera sp. TaxID=1914330 RepID=UPI002D7984BA|nr:ribose-5-phosphate isomerase RpiA [Salinisphaera sp.]HET7314574.1 ribose-5-phosphate isomerase RpiA [Salinisphaera sp.]